MINWFIIVGYVFGGYILLCLLVYLLQDFFLFHPEVLKEDFEFEYDVPFEEVILKKEDGTIIDALHFEVPNSKGVVFYFKGNTRSIKGWSKFKSDFLDKNYNFFIMDYPGFGKSTGKRTERIIYENTQLAYNWLKSKYPENKIVLYARSLGAGFGARIAMQNHPKMLILDSPYYSFEHLANHYAWMFPLHWLLKYKMPLNKYMKRIKSPVFIIHGNKDKLIPYRFSSRLEKLDIKHVKLFTIEGAKHNNLPEHNQYHEVLDKILNDKVLYNQYTYQE